MTPVWVDLVAAIVFGSAAYLGVYVAAMIAARIEPFEDGPAPGKPRGALLIAGATLVGLLFATAGDHRGALLGGAGLQLPQLLVFAVFTFALVGCWYTDVAVGIVPDVFTLGTLAIAVVVALLLHDAYHLVSAAVLGFPFAGAALLSRGRGMGWGDVKLVMIIGALIGFFPATLAISAACLLAVVVAFARRRRSEPLAFAPYLIGAVAFAVAFPSLLPS